MHVLHSFDSTDFSLIACVRVFVQIVYDTNTLYVFAPSNNSRSLWVQSLKEGEWILYVSTEKAADHMLKVQLWTAAWLSSATNHTYASGVTHESKFSVTAAIFTVPVARLWACTMKIASMRT